MQKATIRLERCQACGYCMSVCPTGALSQMDYVNSKGANPVQVDKDKCIGCGMCYTVCPAYVIDILDE